MVTATQVTDSALDALIDQIPKFHVSLSCDGKLISEFLAFACDAESALATAKAFYIALGHAESVVNGWDWCAVEQGAL